MNKTEMLDVILDSKAVFWGLDTEEYNYWKDYLTTLDEPDLRAELLDHFLIEE
jgi:hypothetical protein